MSGTLPTNPHRKALIAKVHIAKTQLGLDEATYRAMVERMTGSTSTKDAPYSKLVDLVDEMKAHGFKDDGGFRPSKRPDVRKIHALWGELRRAGALESPTKAALRAFCANQTGAAGAAKDPEHLTPAEARRVIEALKAWADRRKEN
ncbi:regulatory protein GemA [Telmatospirillum sp.]|uniref:gp16 family protein n=1 Tax=Telmatospirillum sp. TaxID=2079197 RepID=UPI002844651C|nr:regulatory protein GemA [Telmatospirillum sp.]MDR3437154.1 regulatory protein GemA [Telmatospirillum sp.]